jgi:predicted metal-dependent HD superfamily phosphohydrolase
MNDLRDRWHDLWARLRARDDGGDVFTVLVTRYAEPHRAYHNLTHLRHCLREFDAVRTLPARPDAVETALWFHDAIYDTHARDNEERSAAWAAEELSNAGTDTTVAKAVFDLILATKHNAVPVGLDASFVVDIDLAILGQPPDAFDAYEQQIRQEYAWVDEATFRAARAAILLGFLDRPQIDHTEPFRARYERPARSNLERSIARRTSR